MKGKAVGFDKMQFEMKTLQSKLDAANSECERKDKKI